MYSLLVGIGVVLVIMIVVHIIFKIVKFTISVFLLGIALIAIVYLFQRYFGIDLMEVISRHV